MASTLRRIVDAVTVLTAVGVIAGFAGREVDRRQREGQISGVADAVRRFELTLKLHAATEQTDVNARGWPVWVDPAWFEGDPPRNTLVSGSRPWVEVATPEQAHLLHPEVRVALDEDQAGFWYSPYQGVVRARVPMAMSDEGTLELYNTVNRSDLTSLYSDIDPGAVSAPIPMPPIVSPDANPDASADEAEPAASEEEPIAPAIQPSSRTPRPEPMKRPAPHA